MSDSAIFVSGLVLGALITGAVLLLFGQYLFATGAVFTAPDESLTQHEYEIVAEQRIRELPWPVRPLLRRTTTTKLGNPYDATHLRALEADRARRSRQ